MCVGRLVEGEKIWSEFEGERKGEEGIVPETDGQRVDGRER